MRSAVSVILSSPTPDPNMSRPDYDQTVHDHAAMLVLVRHIGEELSTKHFNQIFERINKVSVIKIKENNGNERVLWARFMKEYPVGNNDWGDFQTHRRLLGLITLGKCETEVEFNEICRVHESLKVKYQSTLYDSRCIIFGANTEGILQVPTPSNFRSQPIYYASETEPNADLETQISEFLSSIFWILESKRLEKSREKIDKVSLLLAPFEKRDFVGLDMKSHSNRKRCAGRLTKHLGDFSLQAGLIGEALTFYHSAIDTLRSINDWLWIGSCAEGLCAASALYLLPRIENNSPLHRNASLQERNLRQKLTSLPQAPSETITKMSLSLPRNVLTPEDIYKYYREAIIHYSKWVKFVATSLLDGPLQELDLKKLYTPIPAAARLIATPFNPPTIESITECVLDGWICRTYQNAGVIETEACFKGARIAVKYNSPLQAHTLLQNVIFINLTLNEDEKIQRLMSLSKLYTNIGFHRKASFYRRLTATRYVSARNPQTNWDQCYLLMLQSLPGYNLSLDPDEYAMDDSSGWPRLQRQVLQDLVVAATRLSNNGLATRHMTFLLQTMWYHMTSAERLDAAMQLKKLAELCEGSPVPLVLDNGFVIPPANLLNIPQPLNFVIQNLKVPLRPYKLQAVKEDHGPFLYTPITMGSLDRKKTKNSNELDYLWVAEETCEVILEISNPLPIDLDVTNILLLTSGVVFESIPVSVVLPGNILNQSVILTGVPKEVGELQVKGYSTHTLGVKSNCRLRYIPNIPQNLFSLEVVPALPVLQMFTSSDVAGVEQSSNATIVLFAGESSECVVKLKNTGTLPIEFLEVTVDTLLEPSLQRQIIQWSQKSVQDELPIPAGSTANLVFHLFGASNFLVQNYHGSHLQEPGSLKSSIVSGSSSFPSLPSPKPTSYERCTVLSASSFSFRSPGSSLNSYSSQFKHLQDTSSKMVECHVKVRYSGGPGMKAGYCRTCSMILYIEVLNSIIITSWDVLPAEKKEHFYLVLDVMNLINQEIEVKYTKEKLIQIEEGETCRIPIPIERCGLSKFEEILRGNHESEDSFEMYKICSEHIASQVDLHWKMNNTNREGHASVNGLTISSTMLDILRESPINWEISLNANIVNNAETTTHSVGDTLHLGIWVHNSLSWPLMDIMLQLYLFQDYQNGIINQQLDPCLTIIGSTRVNFSKVLGKGSVYHECNIIFFNAGHYKLNVQCCSLEKYTWKLIPPVEINVVD